MATNSAVVELDFNNEAELWVTEVILYICCILLWILLSKTSFWLCFAPNAPRFKQYDAKSIKTIRTKANLARSRRLSTTVTATGTPSDTSTQHQHQLQVPSASSSRTRSSSRQENIESPLSPEEYQLQICQINRSLRICFITSLFFAAFCATAIS